MRNYFILAIAFSTMALWAQVKVVPTGPAAFRQAQTMERRGQVEEARKIYYSILESNPGNRQAFTQLKTSLIRSGELEDAIRVITSYIQYGKDDISIQVELGELYYRTNQKKRADQYWIELESQNRQNQNFYRSLTYSFARLSLSTRMDSLVHHARAAFNDPAFMALDLANYYHSRGSVSRAVNEFINHNLARPQQKKYVTDRILLLSDENENLDEIEASLLSRLPDDEMMVRQILSSFYFKIRNYPAAYEQHVLMGRKANEDFERWLNFAGNLREEKEFDLAIAGFQDILHSDSGRTLPSQVIGSALLGMGQCYEDQIIPAEDQARLVVFFQDNLLFENHFYGVPEISTEPLENSFMLYDSVLVNMPNSALQGKVQYRLGEIKYRITRDFDGALQSYQAALGTKISQELRLDLKMRIGDIYLAKGDIPAAQQYYLDQLSSFTGQQKISPFQVRMIQANLYAGDVESALTLVESTLSEASPREEYFNDLMEIQDLLITHYTDGSGNDKSALLVFLQAEALIRQNKLSQAKDLLLALNIEHTQASIAPWVILRAAMLNNDLGDTEQALNLALKLEGTALAPQGITLAGEISESSNGNRKQALAYYNQLLEKYPGSILSEPVRFRIRALNSKSGS